MDNSISMDISKEVESERRIVKNTEENFGDQIETSPKELNSIGEPKQGGRMGSMKLISRRFNLWLGPHYKTFCLGYFMTLSMSILLVYSCFYLIQKQQNDWFLSILKYCAIAFCLWSNVFYINTAFSDPGIYYPGKIKLSKDDRLRNCSFCQIKVPDCVNHCYKCNVCIIDFDHHCPWMSKCIGRDNLKSFYAFLLGLVFTVGLFWITIFQLVGLRIF